MTVRGHVDMKNREKYILEFTTPEEIYFPKNCLICGVKTSEVIQKNLFGSFIAGKDYKIDYRADFPVCSSCKKRIAMKTGLKSKSGKLLCTSITLSIPIALILSFLFKAYFFSLSIVLIAIIIPYINHRKKMKPKLKAADFLEFGFEPLDQGKVKVILKNTQYAKIVEEINKAKINEIREALNIKKDAEDSEQVISESKDEVFHQTSDDMETENIESNLLQSTDDTIVEEINEAKINDVREDLNIKKDAEDGKQLISESKDEVFHQTSDDIETENIESNLFQSTDNTSVEEINKIKLDDIKEDSDIKKISEDSGRFVSETEEEVYHQIDDVVEAEKDSENIESNLFQSTDNIIVEEINKFKLDDIKEDSNIKEIFEDNRQLIPESDEDTLQEIDGEVETEKGNENDESDLFQSKDDTSVEEINKSKFDDIKEDSNVKKIFEDSEQLISESDEDVHYEIDENVKTEKGNENNESDLNQSSDNASI